MITERTLKQWRRDALRWSPSNVDSIEPENTRPDTIMSVNQVQSLQNKIIRLTQELMDHYLITKGV